MEKYIVVIMQDNEVAELECDTLKEAQEVRRSFVNYGKCQEITIKTTMPNELTVGGKMTHNTPEQNKAFSRAWDATNARWKAQQKEHEQQTNGKSK